MKARVKWIDGLMFAGESDSGHGVIMDAAEAVGGKNLGVRPMEMLLLGAGGCASIDVLLILQKARQTVTDCWVELAAERADTEPKVFTKIHMHFVVSGTSLVDKRVDRAVSLSAEKYCSASIMLGQMAEITHGYEVREV